MNVDLDTWFVDEILAHEVALTRYLRRVWANQTDIPDLRQDIYVRIYQSAVRERPRLPKSFLFATARNLLADHGRRSRVVLIDYTPDLDSLNILIDEISPEEHLVAQQALRRLSHALDALPDNCRDVVWLRGIEGISQQETAERLGMKESTVGSHMSRGVRALIKAMFAGTVEPTNARHRLHRRPSPLDAKVGA